ncbi:MAG: prepilin-type N-terminal cleavage/methylation domain-containing protein [Candidatus Levyibacteriota bacterium]
MKKGFTLIELLITITILTTLIAATLIAINPGTQFAKANNVKRNSDVNALLSAIGQYAADHQGTLPAGITTSPQTIANTGADICSLLVTLYIAELPVDPLTNGGKPISNCGVAYTTNYTVVKGATDNRVTVSAPATQIPPGTDIISITR